MKYKKILDYIKNWFTLFFIVCFIICIAAGIIYKCTTYKTITSPVEECIIDSLKADNNNIINTIDSLEDIKNEKIIEVKHLNNDSTLILFYELLRK